MSSCLWRQTPSIKGMTQTLISFGHGYSAQALVRLLDRSEWRIVATTRSEEKAKKLRADGIEAVLFPSDEHRVDLDGATHVLISVGPDKDGDVVLRHYGDEIAQLAGEWDWVGYLSTTGVYGDHQGDWVDETTPLTPSTERGRWRVQAEEQWQAIPDLPLHIFRLAGIYGPGRGPFSKVKSGKARRIIKPGQIFSRTHVEDIAQILAASIARPNPGGVYNVCDDEPAPPQDVIAYAAELLGLPAPEAVDFETAEMTPMARSFYAESKRVRNDRIKDELGVTLLYPSYREGLAALLADDHP